MQSDVTMAMTSFCSASSNAGICCYDFSFPFPCCEVAFLFSLPFPCIYPWLTPVAIAMKFGTKSAITQFLQDLCI